MGGKRDRGYNYKQNFLIVSSLKRYFLVSSLLLHIFALSPIVFTTLTKGKKKYRSQDSSSHFLLPLGLNRGSFESRGIVVMSLFL